MVICVEEMLKRKRVCHTFEVFYFCQSGIFFLRLIYCSLKNFFTFSHLDNYDPERGGSLSYPMTKQAVFGINVDF